MDDKAIPVLQSSPAESKKDGMAFSKKVGLVAVVTFVEGYPSKQKSRIAT